MQPNHNNHNSSSKRVTIELSPIQLVWLHSQHLFQKIQQNTIIEKNQVKFYKNNTGVEIRLMTTLEEHNADVVYRAKQQLQQIITDNQIRLITTSLHKDIYVKISREARKQFPNTYIIFLHYETFQNCSKKLKDKFGITSILPQFEKLQKDNPFFCFLIANKSKIDQVESYTSRILNSQISCASTTFSNHKPTPTNNNTIYRKTMSVSSLRGSFTDHDQHTLMDNCRLSVHHSEGEQEIFEVSEIGLDNLTEPQLTNVKKNQMYLGCCVHYQEIQGDYHYVKKKLYYANRLQLSSNPHVQPIYGYSMNEDNLNQWRLTVITDRDYKSLRQLLGTVYLHSVLNKIQILTKVAKCIIELHRNRQSYGDLRQDNILFDQHSNVYLSAIIDKKIPPHTNPILNDIRQYLLLTYRIITEVDITNECLNKKQQEGRYFCTMSHQCSNPFLKQFLNIADRLFIEEITFQQFLTQVKNINKKDN